MRTLLFPRVSIGFCETPTSPLGFAGMFGLQGGRRCTQQRGNAVPRVPGGFAKKWNTLNKAYLSQCGVIVAYLLESILKVLYWVCISCHRPRIGLDLLVAKEVPAALASGLRV